MSESTRRPYEDGPLTALLNKATGGDLEAKRRAFECLWPDIEKLDHIFSESYNVLGGSRVSEPVTFLRGRDVFDSTLEWANDKQFVWHHPGAFLAQITYMLKFRMIDDLRSQAEARRKRIDEMFKSDCEPDLIALADTREPTPDQAAIENEKAEREASQSEQERKIAKEQNELAELERHIAWHESWRECIDTVVTDPIERFIYTAMAMQGLTPKQICQLLKELFSEDRSLPEVERESAESKAKVLKCLRTKTGGDVGWWAGEHVRL